MKTKLLIHCLYFIFTVIQCVPLSAQLRIEKRKHLRGFHVSFIPGKAKVKTQKHMLSRGVLSTEKEIDISPEALPESNLTASLQLFTSQIPGQPSEMLVAAEPPVQTVLTKKFPKPYFKNTNEQDVELKKAFAIPFGAGMVRKLLHTNSEKQLPVDKPPVGKGFAIAGAICAVIALVGTGLFLFSSAAAAGHLLALFAIPGLVLSIFGLQSSKRNLAVVSSVVNGMVCLATLILTIYVFGLILAN